MWLDLVTNAVDLSCMLPRSCFITLDLNSRVVNFAKFFLDLIFSDVDLTINLS